MGSLSLWQGFPQGFNTGVETPQFVFISKLSPFPIPIRSIIPLFPKVPQLLFQAKPLSTTLSPRLARGFPFTHKALFASLPYSQPIFANSFRGPTFLLATMFSKEFPPQKFSGHWFPFRVSPKFLGPFPWDFHFLFPLWAPRCFKPPFLSHTPFQSISSSASWGKFPLCWGPHKGSSPLCGVWGFRPTPPSCFIRRGVCRVFFPSPHTSLVGCQSLHSRGLTPLQKLFFGS